MEQNPLSVEQLTKIRFIILAVFVEVLFLILWGVMIWVNYTATNQLHGTKVQWYQSNSAALLVGWYPIVLATINFPMMRIGNWLKTMNDKWETFHQKGGWMTAILTAAINIPYYVLTAKVFKESLDWVHWLSIFPLIGGCIFIHLGNKVANRERE